jgi:hypothetical protein
MVSFLSVWLLFSLLVRSSIAASAMLVGGVGGLTAGGDIYSSSIAFGRGGLDNSSSISFDSVDGISRLHGSGLKIQVDLLEIVTDKGTFRTSPTHTEFEQSDGGRWAQLYSGDEMTVYYNDEAVVQVSGNTEGSSLTVNGIGYFGDIAIDKENAKLIGMAICRVKNALGSGGQCDASKFLTLSEMFVAMIQSQVDIVDLANSRSGGGGSGAGGDEKGGKNNSPNNKEVGAQIKSALSNFESQLLSGKPLKNAITSHTDEFVGAMKDVKDIKKAHAKNDDLFLKMQAAVGELSSGTGKLEKEIHKLDSRLQRTEADNGGKSALKDDIDKLRVTVREIDAGLSASVTDMKKTADKKEEALRVLVSEADARASHVLQKLNQEAYANASSLRSSMLEEMAVLSKTVALREQEHETQSRDVSALGTTVKSLEDLSGDVGTRVAGLEGSVRNLNATMQDGLDSAVLAADAKFATITEGLSTLASNTTTITNDISTAVAKSNGILSKAIGEMNGTMQVHEAEIGRIREDLVVSVGQVNANISRVAAKLHQDQTAASEMHKAALHSVNASTHDWLAIIEARLLQGISEIANEVTLVEASTKAVLEKARTGVQEDLLESNRTTTTALESAMAAIGKDMDALQTSVTAQLTDILRSVASVSESSAVAREVLSERVTGLTARVAKEEEASTLAVETSAQNREKLGKITQQVEQCDAKQKEGASEMALMRDRLTKLETLVEVLMKK